MTEEEKFKEYLKILNEENSTYKKEKAIQGLLDLYNKQKGYIEDCEEKIVKFQEHIDKQQKEIEELKYKLENVAKIRKCFIEIYNDKNNEEGDTNAK